MISRYSVFVPFILQALAWGPTRLAFTIFGGFDVRGLEHLRSLKKKGVIFAPNHMSEWDPILVRAALPFRLTPLFYVSLESALYKVTGWRNFLYGGAFFRAWGAYPAYKGKRDFEEILTHHIKILSSGQSLCIFPEGGKTKNGEFRDPKAGAAFLAHRTGVPVVPVAIEGVFRKSFSDIIKGKAKVIIQFGAPLSPQDIFGKEKEVTLDDYKQGAHVIMDRIKGLVRDIDAHDSVYKRAGSSEEYHN